MRDRVSHARTTWLLVSGLLFVCLFCQAYPAIAETHHAASPAADQSCSTVAEAVPSSITHWLAGPLQINARGHEAAATAAASLAAAVAAAVFSCSRQSETPALPRSVKRYQLSHTYRL